MRGVFTAVLIGLSTTAAFATRDTPLLDFIAKVESRGDYNAVHLGVKKQPELPISEMTIGDVMAFQRSLKNVTSTAVGRYQFIKDTLAYLVKTQNIPLSARFDAALQDKLAWVLVNECEPSRRISAPIAFGNCLAKVWAGLPLIGGLQHGKSYYEGIAGNKASASTEDYMAALGIPASTIISSTVSFEHKAPQKSMDLEARYAKIRATMLANQRGVYHKENNKITYLIDPYRFD